MHLLRVLSETTSQSITEIMEPHKDILDEMIPPKKHLLRYQPANAQIGLMVCQRFICTVAVYYKSVYLIADFCILCLYHVFFILL